MSTRYLAISDIHGQYDELCVLLQLARYTPGVDQLILMGDYIDRGPKSKEVLELVMQLETQGAIVLSGNHEAIMHAAYTYHSKEAWSHWVDRCRGDATLASFGLSAKMHTKNAEIERILRWIPTLPLYYELDDVIFVHAGVTNDEPLHRMSKRTLLWSRDEFFTHYTGDKLVVFGHTTTPRLHQDPYNSDVYFGRRIIGIDGGSSVGGQLHCLEYPSLRVYSV